MIEGGSRGDEDCKRNSCILHLDEMNIALHLNSSFSLPFWNEDEACWEFCQLLDLQPYIFRLLWQHHSCFQVGTFYQLAWLPEFLYLHLCHFMDIFTFLPLWLLEPQSHFGGHSPECSSLSPLVFLELLMCLSHCLRLLHLSLQPYSFVCPPLLCPVGLKWPVCRSVSGGFNGS